MAYHTMMYLFVFLPIVLLTYHIMPQKWRWCVLLFFGYVFFWSFSGKLLIYLVGTTVFTYCIGLWLGNIKTRSDKAVEGLDKKESKLVRQKYKNRERIVLSVAIIVLLGILGYLKYYNFFVKNMNIVMRKVGAVYSFHDKHMILPIGISFYTLQAIGYMVDIYWGKLEAKRPLGKVALFLGFFPQIMEGPISMYSQTAESLWEGKKLTSENIANGCVRIAWGLFKKIIIADRLFIVVDELFSHYERYHGVMIVIAAVFYTIQLYMEFSGSIDIVIGSGRLFGVAIPENFRQPFFAKNAAEFWRRWHITLGVWLKTYVFYPVSVSGLVKKWNKFGKAHFGKYITKVGVSALCLFPVWLCNGLWHGSRWSYIFYGMYYYIILLGAVVLEPVRNKMIKLLHVNEEAGIFKCFQILKTWVIIFVGELFFEAYGLVPGIQMFKSMFHDFDMHKLWDGTLLSFGLDIADYYVIVAGCIVVAIVDIVKEKELLGDLGLQRLNRPIRWMLYYGLFFAVLIFGAYGIGYRQVDLIYAGF